MSPSSQQPAFLGQWSALQKLVTILDIYNAALAPSQFCVGSGLSHAVSGGAGAALENI